MTEPKKRGGKREGAGRPEGTKKAGPKVKLTFEIDADLSTKWDAKRGELSRPAHLAKLLKWKKPKETK